MQSECYPVINKILINLIGNLNILLAANYIFICISFIYMNKLKFLQLHHFLPLNEEHYYLNERRINIKLVSINKKKVIK